MFVPSMIILILLSISELGPRDCDCEMSKVKESNGAMEEEKKDNDMGKRGEKNMDYAKKGEHSQGRGKGRAKKITIFSSGGNFVSARRPGGLAS